MRKVSDGSCLTIACPAKTELYLNSLQIIKPIHEESLNDLDIIVPSPRSPNPDLTANPLFVVKPEDYAQIEEVVDIFDAQVPRVST